MPISVGITIGSISEPSGICVAESEKRNITREWIYGEEHYLIRKLERLPSGTSYPAIATRAATLVSRLKEYTDENIRIAVDATGKGKPIIDVFEERIREYLITQVYFNYGDQMTMTEYGRVITLGKAFLVTRLVTALQDHRLHLPRDPASEILATELENYQIEIDPDANNRYGAFKVGSQDELVTALGLALIPYPPGPTIA
jgi:hypothetical protein